MPRPAPAPCSSLRDVESPRRVRISPGRRHRSARHLSPAHPSGFPTLARSSHGELTGDAPAPAAPPCFFRPGLPGLRALAFCPNSLALAWCRAPTSTPLFSLLVPSVSRPPPWISSTAPLLCSPMARSPLPGASPSQAASSPYAQAQAQSSPSVACLARPASLLPVPPWLRCACSGCSYACCREAPCSVLLRHVVVRPKLLAVDIESLTRALDTVKRCVYLCPSPPDRNLALLSASLFAGLSPMLPRPCFSLSCRAIIASVASSLATVILTASARDCGRVHRIHQCSVADSTVVASESFACCRASRFPCPVLARFSVRQRALSARSALIPILSSTSPRLSSSVVLVAVPYCAY
jgi:hypothetical protein